MAITANTVYEFQSGGSDSNGGGFDSTIASAGTDYSTITTPQAIITTLSVVNATTTDITVSLTDYTVSTNDIGNIYFNSGGTSTVGFYQITGVNVGLNLWILDRSIGTAAQTCTGQMGGCRKLISSNSFPAALIAGNTVWIKNGSYTMAAFSSQTAGTTTSPISILGYNSSRGDSPTGSNRPTLTFGAASCTFSTDTIVRNFIITTSQASGINTGTADILENCKITSTNATSTNAAIGGNTSGRIVNCEIINASGIGVKCNNFMSIYGCYVHGCTTGISITGAGGGTIAHNIIAGCTTAILVSVSTCVHQYIGNNTLFGAETPAGTGIDGTITTAPASSVFLNNIFYGFLTAVNWQATTPDNWWDYNDFFNNTTNRTNVTAGPHDVALNPSFTNTATGDFSISGSI